MNMKLLIKEEKVVVKIRYWCDNFGEDNFFLLVCNESRYNIWGKLFGFKEMVGNGYVNKMCFIFLVVVNYVLY